MTRHRCAPVLCLALLVGLAGPAHAETDRERQERAIATFERGQDQFRAGRFDAAAGLFKEAFETWEDPAYLFNVAFSFEKAERWRLAVLWYDDFLKRYGDSPNAPDVRLRREAAVIGREAARAQVMVVSVPAGARASTLAHEEEPALSCITPCLLRVDPGPVAVRIELGDMQAERSRSLAPGERWDLDVVLRKDAEVTVDHTPSWVAWSIGGAALVTGIIFAALAQDSHDSGRGLVDRGPLGDADQRRLAGLREDVRDRSLVADIGFLGALAGATVGTILWNTVAPEVVPARETSSWR